MLRVKLIIRTLRATAGDVRMGRDLRGIADDCDDAVAAGDELIENAAADHSGGRAEDDVYGALLGA